MMVTSSRNPTTLSETLNRELSSVCKHCILIWRSRSWQKWPNSQYLHALQDQGIP